MTLLTVLLQAAAQAGLGMFGAALGTALAVIGAALGIGALAKRPLKVRPSTRSQFRHSYIDDYRAALIEGVALFAIVVCGFIL